MEPFWGPTCDHLGLSWGAAKDPAWELLGKLLGHVGFILGSSCRHLGVILSCLGTPELTKAFPEQLPEETLAKDLLLGELLREAI